MFNKENAVLMKKTTTVVLTVMLLVVVMASIWYLRNLVFIMIAGYLIMLALQRPINWIVKLTRLPVSVAIALTYLLFFAILIVAMALLLPSLIRELIGLSRQINIAAIAPNLADELSAFSFNLAEVSELFSRFSSSVSALIGLISSTFNTLFSAVMLLMVSVHLSIEHTTFYKKIYWFTSDEKKVVRVQRFLLLLEEELGGWIVGQVTVMFLIGLVTGLGLYVIGVPYALPLGILAGIFEIVPNIGPILAAIPGVILALVLGGPVTGVIALVFYIILQQVGAMFLTPLVMKNTAHVNPLVSILLIIGGLQLFGTVGALLAIPVYIMLRTFYSYWIVKKTKVEV